MLVQMMHELVSSPESRMMLDGISLYVVVGRVHSSLRSSEDVAEPVQSDYEIETKYRKALAFRKVGYSSQMKIETKEVLKGLGMQKSGIFVPMRELLGPRNTLNDGT